MLIQLQDGIPTGNPVTVENFRMLYPQTSFPAYLTPSDVEPYEFGVYDYSQMPDAGAYQKVTEGIPIRNDFGIWKQNWQIVEMSADEKAKADQQKAVEVRGERNFRLTVSDWTQLSDAPVDSVAWASYRQELRDITTQEGFPWEVVWPEQPAN
jgi:hypothetical protein